MELRFFDEPQDFLDVTGDHLARQPVVSTVVTTVAERIVREQTAGIPWPAEVPCWFVGVLQDGEVVGAAMRTAPFGAYPLFLLPMPEDAARDLAHAVLERGEHVSAANGCLPAVQLFCDEVAARRGGSAEIEVHTRLFELDRLIEPPPVDGRLRPAQPDEESLVLRWFAAFMRDADEQAGRPPGGTDHGVPEAEVVRRNMSEGRVLVWENVSGRPVSVVSASQPAYGVSRLGRCTPLRRIAATVSRVPPSRKSPGGSWRRVRAHACSQTKRTRHQTRSTNDSATVPSSTWRTWWCDRPRLVAEAPIATIIGRSHRFRLGGGVGAWCR